MERILIFSQQKLLITQISDAISKLEPESELLCFTDPIDSLSFTAESPSLSGAVIDIDSDACYSLRFLKVFHTLDSSLPVIFLSKSGKYAVESFQYGAVDYLNSPFSMQRLREALDKLKEKHTTKNIRRVYIKTFGSFEIFVGDTPISWKNSKTKELLAFLIDSRGAEVSSDAIKQTLWPDVDEKKASSNYHTTLHNLRKKLASNGLEHLLLGSRGSQRVDTSIFDCDLYDFERCAEDGSPAACRQAFSLYKGRYLENNAYPWSHFTKLRIDIQFEQLCHNV